MAVKYCLPIIQPNKAEILRLIAANDQAYHYFEIWLDYVQDLDEAFITELLQGLSERLIVPFRRQKLEPIQMSAQQRQASMSQLAGTHVLVDLDISQTDDLMFAATLPKPLRTIVSYHNYELTPDDDQLRQLVTQIRRHNPTILKISTMCATPQDALRLLALLLGVKSQPAIVLGMGEHGLATRILGPLWGNEMSFAPDTAAQASAPGQLTRQQLETIFATLKGEQYGV